MNRSKKTKLEGIIFDIQRFALHDGPGIRTVVFLKGCPLKCKWCSNPESIKPDPQLSYSKTKCKDIENCVSACSENVFPNHFWMPKVKYNRCNACGKCVDVCPTGALKIYGYYIKAEGVIQQVLRDKAYYDKSEGGLTLSGGEPLLQSGFALEIIQRAKEEKIHTCIETAGYVGSQVFKDVMPFTDLFLYDYKITSDVDHEYYTGFSNKKIIENLNLILSSGSKVILRCIIVPGVNNNQEHFQAIARISEHKNIKAVEIIPYHEYGKHKYKELGMEAYEFGIKTVDKELALLWTDEIKNYGCKKIKVG